MSSTTVAEFATELKKSTSTLLEQLRSAGVAKSAPTDVLSEADKQKLLGYLRASHGTATAERKKITLVKKSTSEIKQADSTGKARTIQVEVRKKRTFVKRDEGADTAVVEAPEPEVQQPAAHRIDEAELARREEEARRQAEFIRRQEEELAEKRRQREQAEAREREAAEKAAAQQAESIKEEVPAKAAAKAVVDEATTAVAKAQSEAREKAAAESKARADEDVARAADLGERRRKAEAEAAAIRSMISAPKKVLVPHKAPEPAKPVAKAEAAKPGAAKGTLHKPAVGTGTGRPAAPGAAATPGTPGSGKEVKSAKLSSSWAGDPAKKKAIPTRGDSTGGVGRNSWRGGPRGRRGNERDHRGGDDMQAAPVEARVIEVHVPETITVAELAHKMAVKASEVIKALMKMGQMVTINQPLDQDTAMIVVEEMGHKAVTAALDDPEAFTEEDVGATEGEALPRAPVVTVMGHVDHGKTSLLDYIRRTKVAAGEAGGITQHIGAYHVETDRGMISFLDTPGHEAFTAMRARGAQATDIVVLVVAADDGVKPQTREAVDHAKAAEVPILVAVNKIDKEGAQPDRVRTEMTQLGLQPEEWGGETMFVDVSAKAKTNLDDLLESILLLAEVEELKANPDAEASGVVIESKLDPGRGAVVTVLVNRGTLKVGDATVAGAHWGRVGALHDD